MLEIKKDYKHIGILSAMPEEVGFILDHLTNIYTSKFGDIEIFSGEFLINNEKKILLSIAWSGWGKVSAARATTRLISTTYKKIPIDFVIFNGVAGAVDEKLKQWDMVISESLIQHDMDASPIFSKYVIPSINNQKIYANKIILENVFDSLKKSLVNNKLQGFGALYKGLIGTGDVFISEKQKIKELSKQIKGLLAVEMEGAAFAQVAFQENIDWIVLRTISDSADESAHEEFNDFLEKYKYKSFDLIKASLENLI